MARGEEEADGGREGHEMKRLLNGDGETGGGGGGDANGGALGADGNLQRKR